VVAAALASALPVGACGSGTGSASVSGSGTGSGSGAGGEEEADAPPPFEEADATTKLDVTLQDYAFVGIPDTVRGPNVFFSASIKGSNRHELEILDADGEAVDEIEAFSGGGEHTMAVVLEPGTYTAQCILEEGARTHKELGMVKEFTVEA
jgi:hypothetical protein